MQIGFIRRFGHERTGARVHEIGRGIKEAPSPGDIARKKIASGTVGEECSHISCHADSHSANAATASLSCFRNLRIHFGEKHVAPNMKFFR